MQKFTIVYRVLFTQRLWGIDPRRIEKFEHHHHDSLLQDHLEKLHALLLSRSLIFLSWFCIKYFSKVFSSPWYYSGHWISNKYIQSQNFHLYLLIFFLSYLPDSMNIRSQIYITSQLVVILNNSNYQKTNHDSRYYFSLHFMIGTIIKSN